MSSTTQRYVYAIMSSTTQRYVYAIAIMVGLFGAMSLQHSKIETKFDRLDPKINMTAMWDKGTLEVYGCTTFFAGVINIDEIRKTPWSDSIYINLSNRVDFETWTDSEGVRFRIFTKEAKKCGKK